METNHIQEIFLRHGDDFRKEHTLSGVQLKAMSAIERCGREEAGFHRFVCPACQHTEIAYNSCRNRHCPNCQGLKQLCWIDKVKSQLLPVKYFHIVFTLPEFINDFVLLNHELIYDMLFEASWHAMKNGVSYYCGFETGALSVLHTWGQNLSLHPHIHMLVPAGGLDPDGMLWIKGKKKFLLPVRSLSKIFRARFLFLFLGAFFEGKLVMPDNWKKDFVSSFKERVREKDWVVYSEKSKQGPAKVIQYLGRYINRVAISNARIMDWDDEWVLFHYKDYADRNKRKTLRLSVDEFIRRFLLHILPPHFCKLRYYGLFSIKNRTAKLGLCFILLDKIQLKPRFEGLKTVEIIQLIFGKEFFICPCCGIGRMQLLKPPT
jgi:hypothetical protein